MNNKVINFPQHVYVPNYGLASSITYQAGIAPNSSWQSNEYGPNTSVIDTNTVMALDRVITGQVTDWNTIETAELAVRALILHENIYWMFPAALVVSNEKIHGGNNTVVADESGHIVYPIYTDTCSILDTLRSAGVSSYSVYGGGLYVKDKEPQYGSQFWMENYQYLTSGNTEQINNIFLKSLDVPFFRNSYYLSPKAIGAGSYLGNKSDRDFEAGLVQEMTPILPEKILSKLDDSWADDVSGSSIGLNIRLGPFLALVLSRAQNRESISSALLEIREEFADARGELWQLFQAPLTEKRSAVAVKNVRKLQRAISSIVPAAYPQKDRPFSLSWDATHAIADLVQTGGMLSGVKFIGDLLIKRDLDWAQVSTVDATRMIAASLKNADESLITMLRKHLTPSELSAIGL